MYLRFVARFIELGIRYLHILTLYDEESASIKLTRSTCNIIACELSTIVVSIIKFNEWKVQRGQRYVTRQAVASGAFVVQSVENRTTSDRGLTTSHRLMNQEEIVTDWVT